MKKIRLIVLAIIIFLTGYTIRGWMAGAQKPQGQALTATGQSLQQWWTCAMHPQIRQPKPGKCPICFMDLVPVATSAEALGPRQISFSPEAVKLMELETTPVQRKFVTAEIRMVGKVDYDETRIKSISAWAPGGGRELSCRRCAYKCRWSKLAKTGRAINRCWSN